MTAREQWLRLLEAPEPAERVLGLEGLTDADAAGAREHLLRALSDRDSMVRAAVARLGGRVEPPLAVDELEPLLMDGDPEVRLRAVRALEGLAAEAVLPVLERRLAAEQDQRVLASLAHRLGEKGQWPHLPLLAGLLAHADERVRANAVEGLETLLGRCYQQWLAPLAEDPNNRVRANAAVALGRFDEAGAAAMLASMVVSDSRWFRASAAWAAGASGKLAVVDAVLPLLDDPDPEIRIQTIRSLARHRQLPTRQALQKWLDREDDPQVLQYASQILQGEDPGR